MDSFLSISLLYSKGPWNESCMLSNVKTRVGRMNRDMKYKKWSNLRLTKVFILVCIVAIWLHILPINCWLRWIFKQGIIFVLHMGCYSPLEEDELHLELMFIQCSTKIVILCIQLASTKLFKTQPCLVGKNHLEKIKRVLAIFIFECVGVLGKS
jgi:hypothetical protein